LIRENEQNIGGHLGLHDYRYFAEKTSVEYIRRLAFTPDVEAISIAIGSNYFTVCLLCRSLSENFGL